MFKINDEIINLKTNLKGKIKATDINGAWVSFKNILLPFYMNNYEIDRYYKINKIPKFNEELQKLISTKEK